MLKDTPHNPFKIVFFKKITFNEEMKLFQNVRNNNEEKAKCYLKMGSELMQLASDGSYFKFTSLVSTLSGSEETYCGFPFIYFLYKSLELSLFHCHFMVSTFIIDTIGFPLNDISLRTPNPLITSLRNKDLSDDICYEIINFLSMKHFDFNLQVGRLTLFLISFLLHECLRKIKPIFLLYIMLLKINMFDVLNSYSC
jgi:hypothetical protein